MNAVFDTFADRDYHTIGMLPMERLQDGRRIRAFIHQVHAELQTYAR